MSPVSIRASRVKRARSVDRILGQLAPDVARWLVRCFHQIADGNIQVHPSLLHDNFYFASVDRFTIRMSLNEDEGALVILDVRDGGG